MRQQRSGMIRPICACLLAATALMAADAVDLDALAKESEAKCVATAQVKATPELIIERTNAAAKLIETAGEAAFAQLRGAASEFIFAGTYITVKDENGVNLFHPIKYKLIGKAGADQRDAKGKAFVVDACTIAREAGSGWIDYYWPRPGSKDPEYKVTYVKKAVHQDRVFVLMCGTSDLSPEQARQLLGASR